MLASILKATAVSLFLIAASSADTLTHKETGEKLEGKIGSAKINAQTLVILNSGRRVYLDLTQYDIVIGKPEHEEDADAPSETQESDRSGGSRASIGPKPPRKLSRRLDAPSVTVYVIPISGALDFETPYRWLDRFDVTYERRIAEAFSRTVELARKRKPSALVIMIEGPGGNLSVAREISNVLCGIRDMQTIAFVRNDGARAAISADALIALSCKQIFMSPGSRIGAATPYYDTGAIEVDAKLTSVVQAQFRGIAEQNEHCGLLAEAMVNPKVALHLVKPKEGRALLVKAESVDEAYELAGIPEEECHSCHPLSKPGEVLTLTAKEAEEYGLSSGTTDSLDGVLRLVGMRLAKITGESLLCGACRNNGKVNCPICKGDGGYFEDRYCTACAGAGGSIKIETVRKNNKIVTEERVVPCPICGGQGTVRKWIDCSFCNGGHVKCPFCKGKGSTK
ncbi:MAG TPA: hypothetical protein VM141_01410 [Planctomycetota bacterium]|nr:hypothetical protein [Planctomycetota bacterium]